MQHVTVCARNPAKSEAVRRAFEELHPGAFTLHTHETDGGTDQPWGERATRAGAAARARSAREAEDAHWGIGLEGGLVEDETGILVTSWIAACRADGRLGLARTPGFYLPEEIAALVRAGHELAVAWREARGIERIGSGGGTVGQLTGGHLDRARLYADAVVLAVTLAGKRP